jgi:hypothetical protein
MARKLRIQYPGAVYYVMSCGDHQERISADDQDRILLFPVACRIQSDAGVDCTKVGQGNAGARGPTPARTNSPSSPLAGPANARFMTILLTDTWRGSAAAGPSA